MNARAATKNKDASKRAEVAQRRRQEIIDAACPIFALNGYRRGDVQEIANAAGVAKGTVYLYFKSKKELFLACVDSGVRELTSQIIPVVAEVDDPHEKIRVGARMYMDFFDNHHDLAELLIHERSEFKDSAKPTYFVYRDREIGILESIIADGISQGIFRKTDVGSAAYLIANLFYGTMLAHFMRGDDKPLTELCDEALDLVFQGILVRKEGSSDAAKAK